MSEVSSILSLPYIQPSQAQKHVTHNEAVAMLDLVVQLSVATRSQSAPPPAPLAGLRFIVPAGATGVWAGQQDMVSVYDGTAWRFVTPVTGWIAWVEDETGLAVFDATNGWSAYAPATTGADTFGINTGADSTNRLAVAADATLLTHTGAGHQLKLNKAGSADTASLLYQSNWSGRAEMGLAGNDDFAIKVSADGASWLDALRADGTTGAVTLPQGAQIDATITGQAVTQGPSDTTAGRVIRTEDGYVKGSVVGTVSEASGIPTGAIIEAGSNANGDYTRFADGTQICTSPNIPSGAVNTAVGALFRSASIGWPFPMPFSSPPAVSGTTGNAGRWLTLGYASELSTFTRIISPSPSGASSDARLMAVGRWF